MEVYQVTNDFRSGVVDEQIGFRSDLELYQTSASVLENVAVMHAGGLKQREGVSILTTVEGAKRLIPFSLSSDEQYLLVLAPGVIHIYTPATDGSGWTLISGSGFATSYTDEDLEEIKFAQDNERLVIVQEDHPPIVVSKTGDNAFRVQEITLDTTTERTVEEEDEDGNTVTTEYYFDYEGLFTENNFPSVVTFCANRLWFGASKENPGRMWASQPFIYNNFQDFAYYKVIDETVTVEQYLKAIEAYTSSVTDNGDGTETRIDKTVSADGYVIITTGIYDQETGLLVGEESVETYNYTEAAVTWEELVREDSAMVLDIASDRNEEVRWIAYCGGYIMVGTASSEWAMDSSINAQTASIWKLASYGSRKNVPCCYGARNIFYMQLGGKRLRSIAAPTSDDYGPEFIELTYKNGTILECGVVDMVWQRVPDPRIYAVLADGSMAVLGYDNDYGIDAWVHWTFSKECISVAVVDTDEDQTVFLLFSDGTIGYLDDSVCTDFGSDEFETRVVTNYLDTLQYMPYSKKTYEVSIASAGTEYVAGVEGTVLKAPQNYSHRLSLVPLVNKGDFKDGVRLEIQGVPGQEFRIHAVLTKMEVF